MKKKCFKFLVIIGVLALLSIIGNSIQVQAVLQSNGGTPATKKIDDWILNIRKMESTGGTLGLNETINTTGLLATTDSNGLDCHMEKNTEYGAMVLLSASSYGNPNIIKSGDTTTGNVTGVVMNINKEWVAASAIPNLTRTTYYKNANSRYVNNDYGETEGGKYHKGDAMQQGGWHSDSPVTTWFYSNGGYSGLLRAYSGSVFSYYGDGYVNDSDRAANYTRPWASRAVIVIGEGL